MPASRPSPARNALSGLHARALAGAALLASLVAAPSCLALPSSGAISVPGAAAQPPRTPAPGLDPTVPSPASILGHEIGARAARYEPMVAYLRALADASPLVTLTEYGASHQGRALYYLTITSADNHARLEQIRAANAKLADPRTLASDAEADRIVADLPGVAWLAYCIHGDELSPTDAALEVAYQLAARTDDQARRLRDELVIHIDPLQNPDGRERYLAQIASLSGKIGNTDYQSLQHAGLWGRGRGNHYLFDLNRDWLMMVHPETHGRAEVIQRWNPHLLVDSHEMSGLDTYLFDPPRDPRNVCLSADNARWRRAFSADQAGAFDEHGWSYYTGEWYDEWYPGYTNAWANLRGGIGILYEAAGMNAASIKQQSGEVRTFADTIRQNVVGTFANLESLRANRRAVLGDFLRDRRWAVSGEGPMSEVFLLPPPGDPALLDRFLTLLGRQGIEFEVAADQFAATGVRTIWGERDDARIFPAGTVIVRSGQPHRRLLHAILGFDPRLTDDFLLKERHELENRRGTLLYDVTAWNIPMAFGLESCWADSVPAVRAAPRPPARAGRIDEDAGYGWLIDGASADIFAAIIMLHDAGAKPRVASKPFKVGGRDYLPGTVLLRNHENPANLGDTLAAIAAKLPVEIIAARTALAEDGPDLGGQRFHLLQQPRVALASQWPISSTSFGATWHLLDNRLGLRVSPVNVQALGALDLRPYNVLIIPDAGGALGAVLDSGGAARSIKRWVEEGGTLIALGNAAATLASADRDLSAVRPRDAVLPELKSYAEAVRRERAARSVAIDPAAIWGDSSPKPEDSPAADAEQPKAPSRPDPTADQQKELDAWQRLFRPQGAVLAAELNHEHWLCFGLGRRLPALVSGDAALMSKPPVATPARLAPAASLRLSGLLWPEARDRLADSAYATVERVGRGQVILFASDPFLRGYFEGTGRMLQNAVLLGPAMGASAPMPW